MSTTLVPPSCYVVDPRGGPARPYNTLREVAAAIYPLAPTPATLSAMTGSRPRSLTDAELRDLRRDIRALRIHTGTTGSAIALAPIHMTRVAER